MQTVLKSLPFPVPLTGASISPADPGDGSFTDAFAEFISASEPVAEVIDPIAEEAVVPVVWGGPVIPMPSETALLSSADLFPDAITHKIAHSYVATAVDRPTSDSSEIVLIAPDSPAAPGTSCLQPLTKGVQVVDAELARQTGVTPHLREAADLTMPQEQAREVSVSDGAGPTSISVQTSESHLPSTGDARVALLAPVASKASSQATLSPQDTVREATPSSQTTSEVPVTGLPDRFAADSSTVSRPNLPTNVPERTEKHPAQPDRTSTAVGQERAVANQLEAIVTNSVPELALGLRMPGKAPESAGQLIPGLVAQDAEPFSPAKSVELKPTAFAVLQAPDQRAHLFHPASSFWERLFLEMTLPQEAATRAIASDLTQTSNVPVEIVMTSITSVPPSSIALLSSQPVVLPILELSPRTLLHCEPVTWKPTQDTKLQLVPSVTSPTEAVPGLSIAGRTDNIVALERQADLVAYPTSLPSLGYSAGSASGPQSAPVFQVPQIASQLAEVLIRNAETFTEVALAPEELGRVKLRMEHDPANPDRMVILISVERPETLELLRRHSGELADAIRAAGYSGADIGFGQQGQRNSPGHTHDSDWMGSVLTSDDTDQALSAQRHSVGASLDIRL